VADALAPELRWDEPEVAVQLAAWAAEARAEGVIGSA
jgi:hypothetical protein